MAQATLLDIAKINGNDTVVGLIEENLTYAPELSVIPSRTIRGTTYTIGVRSGYPGVSFRNANEGVTYGKSTFEKRAVECFILSGNVRADVAVARAYEDGEVAWMALEASGVMRQALIEVGSQTFYGVSVDAKGFPGLQAIHTAYNAGLVVDAGGTTADTGSSVYGVKFGPQDVQLIFGNSISFELSDWRWQMVNDGTAGQDYDAHVAALTAWVGLQVGNKYSVGRLKDCTADSGKGCTDARLAELLSKYPVGHKPDRWFMSRRSAFQLQSSRTATTIQTGAKTPTGSELMAPMPTESNGIPITITDSLVDTEALS